MSKTSSDLTTAAGSADAASAASLFRHEVRRDGRVVVTLRAYETAEGVIVDSEVFAVTNAAGEPGQTRPFTFSSLDHARRFADDMLIALEYLNCSVT